MNIKYSKAEDILLLEISDGKIDYAEEDGPIIIHYSKWGHYNIKSAIIQKIDAIASRSVVQARDIYDLYILNSQFTGTEITEFEVIEKDKLEKAYNNVFVVTFEQFRDSVVLYLSPEEQIIYSKDTSWDEVRLKAANLIGEFRREHE